MTTMNEDSREVVLEWSVTTTMPRWVFDDAEEDGVDIYDAVSSFIEEIGFTRLLSEGTFTSISATNNGVSFRE